MARAKRQESNAYNGFKIVVGADFRGRLRISDPSQPNPDYPDNSPFKYLPMLIDNIGFIADIRTQPSRNSDLIKTLSTDNACINKEPDFTDSPANTTPNDLRGWIELFIDNAVTSDDSVANSIPENEGTVFYDVFMIPDDNSKDRIKILQGEMIIEGSTTNADDF